jgi:hypothetical protein
MRGGGLLDHAGCQKLDEWGRPMRRVAPSVIAREQLNELLATGPQGQANIVSLLLQAIGRLVVQELVEAEQAGFLGGRAVTSAAARTSGARATATCPAGSAP